MLPSFLLAHVDLSTSPRSERILNEMSHRLVRMELILIAGLVLICLLMIYGILRAIPRQQSQSKGE